jgi:hypothetical protein
MNTARIAVLATIAMLWSVPLTSARGEDRTSEGKPLTSPAASGWDCLHRRLPPELSAKAATAAVRENPENDIRVENGSPRSAKGDALEAVPLGAVDEKGVISTGRKWQPGRTIRVRFLGGDPVVQRRVKEYAMEWTRYANIQFQFVGPGDPAEVRIAFEPGGSWSLLGTDALTAPAGQPTMNFGWLRSDSDEPTYTSVVLHEFGHMLGLVHEHMHPGGQIKWNYQAAYAYYQRTQGWDRAMVKAQVFDVYYNSDAAATKLVDPRSIMMYPIPEGLANIVVGWNTQLSSTDKDFIGRHYYPAPGAKPTELVVGHAPVFGAVRSEQAAAYRFRVQGGGEYVVQVRDLPVEVRLLADGPRKLASGESVSPKRSVIVGTYLDPGEYTVQLRRNDRDGSRSGQFRISVKRAGE